MQALEEFKMKSNSIDRQTAWIDKVLNNPNKHFEIVVKFAQEAARRLGRNKDE
jgi:hypothetical protein